MTEYMISLDDGRVVFRNPETDKHVNLRPIPKAVVDMINGGEVTWRDVVNAITAKEKEDGTFDFAKYLEGKKALNIRQSNPQEGREPEKLAARDDGISADEVRKAVASEASKTDRKTRAKKVNEALEKTPMPDIFSNK